MPSTSADFCLSLSPSPSLPRKTHITPAMSLGRLPVMVVVHAGKVHIVSCEVHPGLVRDVIVASSGDGIM